MLSIRSPNPAADQCRFMRALDQFETPCDAERAAVGRVVLRVIDAVRPKFHPRASAAIVGRADASGRTSYIRRRHCTATREIDQCQPAHASARGRAAGWTITWLAGAQTHLWEIVLRLGLVADGGGVASTADAQSVPQAVSSCSRCRIAWCFRAPAAIQASLACRYGGPLACL